MSLRSAFAPFLKALGVGQLQRIGVDELFGDSFDTWQNLLASLEISSEVLYEVYATNSLAPHFRYHHFRKPKKDGRLREITEPEERLKQLQKTILRWFLNELEPHHCAMAFRPGRSTADHAWTHAGAEILILADVQDFFPNTMQHRIAQWWRGQMDEDLAHLLTLLTTYQGGLPQGAPTSPALSNLVNVELDILLAELARTTHARYSRYCDDLAFSWKRGDGPPGSIEATVRRTLHKFGYTLHPEKGWHRYDRRQEAEITGLILTRGGGVTLPERVFQAMREVAQRGHPGDQERLAGYRGYQKMLKRRTGTR